MFPPAGPAGEAYLAHRTITEVAVIGSRDGRHSQTKNTIPPESSGYRYMGDQGLDISFQLIMLGDKARASKADPAVLRTNGRRQEPPARTFLKQATSSNPEATATPTGRTTMHPGHTARLPWSVNSASSGCVAATSCDLLKLCRKLSQLRFSGRRNAPTAASKCLSRRIRAKNSTLAIFCTSPINQSAHAAGEVRVSKGARAWTKLTKPDFKTL